MEKYALITGASAGIGRAMAQECARRGFHLLLVALDEPALHDTATALKTQFPIEAHAFGVDLTLEDAPRQICDWCRCEGFPVSILINNAGFGHSGMLESIPLPEYYKMLSLNNRAMVGLTHLFLPLLKQQPKAYILNMSSMEATLPRPYKAVYAGTKNFVFGFTLALREELKSFKINVSVLCPGPTATNEGSLMRIREQGKKARLMVLMPEPVAKAAIRGMMENKQIIIPGVVPKMIVRLMNWFPTPWKMAILERLFHSDREHRWPSASQPARK